MELSQNKMVEKTEFKVACDTCGSLSIKLVDPAKVSSSATIQCGRCNAVRGTLDDLHRLARSSKNVFEF